MGRFIGHLMKCNTHEHNPEKEEREGTKGRHLLTAIELEEGDAERDERDAEVLKGLVPEEDYEVEEEEWGLG